MAGCETCREAVESYRLMFSGMTEMPAAGFDFDVKMLVLPQLQVQRKPQPALKPVLVIIAVVLAALTGGGYYFRKDLGEIFNRSLPYLLYCLGPAAVMLLVLLLADMLNTHRQKMNRLEYY